MLFAQGIQTQMLTCPRGVCFTVVCNDLILSGRRCTARDRMKLFRNREEAGAPMRARLQTKPLRACQAVAKGYPGNACTQWFSAPTPQMPTWPGLALTPVPNEKEPDDVEVKGMVKDGKWCGLVVEPGCAQRGQEDFIEGYSFDVP